jgi:hypothetical protein
VDSQPPLRTDDVMRDLQGRVRANLRARLRAAGATEFADEALFEDVDAIFRQALSNDDRGALLLPSLLHDDWQPELSLRLASHRGGLGTVIVFIKRRLLLPLTRWLFEYALENFRRQHRLNLALMACLQTLAVEHVRLSRELAARSEIRGEDAAPRASAASAATDTSRAS